MTGNPVSKGRRALRMLGAGALVLGLAALPAAAVAAPGTPITGTALVVVDNGQPSVFLAVGARLTRVTGLADEAAAGRIASGDVVSAQLEGVAPATAAGKSATASAVGGVATKVVRAAAGPNALPPGSVETHNITVVRANWPGAKIADAPSMATIRAAVGDASDYWREVSDGRIEMTTVAERDNQALSATPCTGDLQSLVEVGVRAGWTTGPRNHLVVVTPTCPAAMFRGYGTLGGTREATGIIFLNGTVGMETGAGGDTGSTMAHEFGHNVSLHHANEVTCDDRNGALAIDATPETCRAHEYEGLYSVMASLPDGFVSPHLTAHHLEQLGILDDVAVTDVTNVGAPVKTVTITPAALRNGVRTARVDSADGDTYYFEYRTAVGLDTQFLGAPASPILPSGVIVNKAFRQAPGTAFKAGLDFDKQPMKLDHRSDYLLDANALNNPWNSDPMESTGFEGDPMLPLNEPVAFGDLTARLTSLSADEATIELQFPPTRPQPTRPSPPRAVTASLVGATSAKVSWTQPEDTGGMHITGYQVKSVPGGHKCQAVLPTGCTVEDLPTGIQYEFAVTATNAIGTSNASALSNPLKVGTVVEVTPTPTPTATPLPTETPTPTPTVTPLPTQTTTNVDYTTDTVYPTDTTYDPTSYDSSSYTTTSQSTGAQTLAQTGSSGIGGLILLGLGLIVMGGTAMVVARRTN